MPKPLFRGGDAGGGGGDLCPDHTRRGEDCLSERRADDPSGEPAGQGHHLLLRGRGKIREGGDGQRRFPEIRLRRGRTAGSGGRPHGEEGGALL